MGKIVPVPRTTRFAWSVKSQKKQELVTWMNAFGLAEVIAGELGQQNMGDAPVYSGAVTAMRRLDDSNTPEWVVIVYGYWSDDIEIGYRGVLAVCKNNDEERIGDQFLRETMKELNTDVEFWNLKHNESLVLNTSVNEAGFKHHWLPPTA